jgi:hypothetical protein
MLKPLMILPYFVEFLELPAPIVIVQDLPEVASIIVMTLRGKRLSYWPFLVLAVSSSPTYSICISNPVPCPEIQVLWRHPRRT